MPATPTVSVCPQNIRLRPGARPVERADDVGPAGRGLRDLDRQADGAHLLGDAARDGELAGGAGHERRVHRVDRDEIAQQPHGGIRVERHVSVAPARISVRRCSTTRLREQKRTKARPMTASAPPPRLARGRARRRRPRARRRRLGARPAPRRRRRRISTRGVRHRRRIGWRRCSARSDASRPSARAFRSTSSSGLATGDIDVALPRRESKQGRGHKGFEVQGDPVHVDRRGRAPPRLHRQRHRLGSADRRLRGSLRRPRRSGAASAARRRSGHASATTACACCARCSSPPASSSRSTTPRRRCAARIPLDDLPRRAHLGRDREAAAARRAAVDRPGAGARPRRGGAACSPSCCRWSAASRSPSGIPRATSGCTR